ncbi:UNVERIFIED_CONTAM: hypothetical protein FKN15_064227 [Acipenser sinensis]
MSLTKRDWRVNVRSSPISLSCLQCSLATFTHSAAVDKLSLLSKTCLLKASTNIFMAERDHTTNAE